MEQTRGKANYLRFIKSSILQKKEANLADPLLHLLIILIVSHGCFEIFDNGFE